jgi:hypothetical protein
MTYARPSREFDALTNFQVETIAEPNNLKLQITEAGPGMSLAVGRNALQR